jgi:hypothetical protein
MKRTVAGEAIQALEVIQAEPEFLAQCQAALAALNRGSGQSVKALVDLGRIGQNITADSGRWVRCQQRDVANPRSIWLQGSWARIARHSTWRCASSRRSRARHSSRSSRVTAAPAMSSRKGACVCSCGRSLRSSVPSCSNTATNTRRRHSNSVPVRKLRGPRGDCTASPPPKNLRRLDV